MMSVVRTVRSGDTQGHPDPHSPAPPSGYFFLILLLISFRLLLISQMSLFQRNVQHIRRLSLHRGHGRTELYRRRFQRSDLGQVRSCRAETWVS